MFSKNIRIDEYDYGLPAERIAAFPLPQRDRSKLLIYHSAKITDRHFHELPEELASQSTLIINDTRVIQARILFQKETGGVIEIFCLQPSQQTIEVALTQTGTVQWDCLIGGASKWKPGQVLLKQLSIDGSEAVLSAFYIERKEEHFVIGFSWQPANLSFSEILQAAGMMPLPPYIKRAATAGDKDSYQTIFSQHDGSVAAPTAALHFTPSVFAALEQKNITVSPVTLHVGAGTFKPVKTANAAEHAMHREPFSITLATLDQLINAGQVITVGTTSLRTVESLYWLGVKCMNAGLLEYATLDQWEGYELAQKFRAIHPQQSLQAIRRSMLEQGKTILHFTTALMIVPGYRFRMANALITNFHQPKSTLLLLVSAFIGEDWKKVYRHALDNEYRFLSYGDSSLLWRKSSE